MNNIVSANNLQKQYTLGQSHVVALADVTLNIEAGEFVILSGPSGSGKSTLLQLLGCLDKPDDGSIKVLGINTNLCSDNDLADFRAQNLGFIFQSFNLIQALTVYENIEYPLLLNKVTNRKEKVDKIIAQVGLGKFTNAYPATLSGGQRQRVAIARALIHKPNLIIADEPTANLDSKTGDSILRILFNLADEDNTTVVLSTHDPKLIDLKHTRQIYLSDGKIIEDRRPQTVKVSGM